MKVKYFVTMTEDTKVKIFRFTLEQKQEAIALLKNLSMRFKDVELFSIDSDDEDITYNITRNYI